MNRHNIMMEQRGSTGRIDIAGVLSKGDGAKFKSRLATLQGSKTIDVHIHSPGGQVGEGLNIFDGLKAHPAKIVTRVVGIAASMASVILLAGDERHIVKNGRVMVHNPEGNLKGDDKELEKAAGFVRHIREQITSLYAKLTNLTREKVAGMMDAETWLNAEEAVQMGFAHIIDPAIEYNVSACASVLGLSDPLGHTDQSTDEFNQKVRTMWDKKQNLRETFLSFEGYAAYCSHYNEVFVR